MRLVLSLLPGIDLLGLAFAEVFPDGCIVRGPDVIFGSLHDVRTWHAPKGVSDLILAGPPCQSFSRLANLIRAQGRQPRFGNLIPELERIVGEAQPTAFLMENVPQAPVPAVPGYVVDVVKVNNRWIDGGDGIGAEQNRERLFCFGTRDGRRLVLDYAALESPLRFVAVTACHEAQREPSNTVLGSLAAVPVKIGGSGKVKATVISGNGFGSGSDYRRSMNAVTSNVGGPGKAKQLRYSLAEACRLQGIPETFFDDSPFTKDGALKAVANGVPLPLGRAIARAVRRALEASS